MKASLGSPALVPQFKWSQVIAYRVHKNHLDRRADKLELEKVVSDLCGVQAQLLPAAELALWSRVEGVERGFLERSLFESRDLFRTWSMRGTLHVLPSAEFQLYIGALKNRTHYRKGAWLRAFGVSLDEMDRITGLVGKCLEDGPLTRKELAEKITSEEGKHLSKKLLSGWGELFKPAAYNGMLALGPGKNGEVAFVRADKWLDSVPDMDPTESFRDILRKFLSSYGPATPEAFARWWGTDVAQAKRLFKSIQKELALVSVEGYECWFRNKDMATLERHESSEQVRLLPNFDSYTLGFKPRDRFVPPRHEGKVFRPQAWVSPVVLVDGKIVGVWERNKHRNILEVRLFGRLDSDQKKRLKNEVDAMSKYIGQDLSVSFSRTATSEC